MPLKFYAKRSSNQKRKEGLQCKQRKQAMYKINGLGNVYANSRLSYKAIAEIKLINIRGPQIPIFSIQTDNSKFQQKLLNIENVRRH